MEGILPASLAERRGSSAWLGMTTGLEGGGVLAEDYFEGGAPAFVEGDEGPGDAGGEMAQNDFGGGVDLKGGGYEVEAWVFRGEAQGGEVAVALELGEAGGGVGILAMMCADAEPVVETLEGELGVLRSFQLDDRETVVREGDGEEIEQAAVRGMGETVGAGDGGDLGVDEVG